MSATTKNGFLVTVESHDVEICDFDLESDDDSAIFGDVVSCVSGEVLS